MQFFYTLGIRLYAFALRLASPFHAKAKLWVTGRKNIFQNLDKALLENTEKVVWIHVSSLGEFEQGRPLIEQIKEKYPQYKVVLTFFSPSGYEIRKDYSLADVVTYLPIDTPKNAKQFFDIVRPAKVFFVKYDFWYHYLHEANKRDIPTYLISAIFRKNQLFFKSYGGFYRRILHFFDVIFVQDLPSANLLKSIGYENAVEAGDTRVDRVVDLAKKSKPIAGIEEFKGVQPLLVAGSTWQADEEMLIRLLQNVNVSFKIIFAPHEVDGSHLATLENQLNRASISFIRYSKLSKTNNWQQKKVLLVDNIGLLSSLYQYASIAYVGGGFGAGIHNTLEPATFGLPVIFGKKHQKFNEAVCLVARGGAFCVRDYNELEIIIKKLLSVDSFIKQSGNISKAFIDKQKGATRVVLSYCFSENY